MQIFLSWSKPKSKEIAIEMRRFLLGLFKNDITIWMSSESIKFGTYSLPTIANALRDSDKCISIITQSNYESPWILYEAGAIAGHKDALDISEKSIVVPILFDDIDADKLKTSPLCQFQFVVFSKINIQKLVRQINEETNSYLDIDVLNDQFELNWTSLNDRVTEILCRYSVCGNIPVTCDFLIEELGRKNFPSPFCGNVIQYETDFETQKLYEVLLENADKRLWIFGRKNRKLFATENRDFFSDLKRRKENGFDFRCLFLNPNKKELLKKAQRNNNFENNLNNCIDTAKNVLLDAGIIPKEVCKFYSIIRTEEIIIIDNVVIFSIISYDDDNYPKPLTKASFSISDIETAIGKKYYNKFIELWKHGEEFY